MNDFRCVCTDGYDGKDCSHDIDDCASSPCFKGSTCVDGIAEYKCICMNGMTGRNCEIDIGITIIKLKLKYSWRRLKQIIGPLSIQQAE